MEKYYNISILNIELKALNSLIDGSIKTITIPNSVTNIGYRAFDGCSSLTSITIPNSVNLIDNYCFMNCNLLKNINFNGTIEEWNTIELSDYWNTYSAIETITCSDGTITL